jgi:hypothetical protein
LLRHDNNVIAEVILVDRLVAIRNQAAGTRMMPLLKSRYATLAMADLMFMLFLYSEQIMLYCARNDMARTITLCIISFVLGILASAAVISMLYQLRTSVLKRCTDKAEDVFKQRIEDALPDGTFVFPDYFFYLFPAGTENALLKHLINQNGIKHFYCDHDAAFPMDVNTMLILSSMDDLEKIYLQGCPLKGKLFKPLDKLPKLHTITLYCCRIDEEGCESLSSIKNLRVLALLCPREIERDSSGAVTLLSTEKQKILVDALKRMSHLRHLMLDHTFTDWEAELTEALPNTVVFIDHQDADHYGCQAVFSRLRQLESLECSCPPDARKQTDDKE